MTSITALTGIICKLVKVAGDANMPNELYVRVNTTPLVGGHLIREFEFVQTIANGVSFNPAGAVAAGWNMYDIRDQNGGILPWKGDQTYDGLRTQVRRFNTFTDAGDQAYIEKSDPVSFPVGRIQIFSSPIALGFMPFKISQRYMQ